MVDDFDFSEEELEYARQEAFLEEDLSGVRSVLNPDVEMDGILHLRNGIEINGKYEGAMFSNSLIHVKPNGELNGEINAFHVMIEGKSHAQMTAKKRLEILKGGSFIGTLSLQPEVIVLSEHAVFGKEEKIADEFAAEFTRDRTKKIAEESGS